MHFFDSILKKVYIRKVYLSFPHQFFYFLNGLQIKNVL
jgi:hypothetical protein